MARPSVWDECVPHFLHPTKVAIIEALTWVEEPLSARMIDRLLNDGSGVPLISYHVRGLADARVLTVARTNTVRGAVQTFYTLASISD